MALAITLNGQPRSFDTLEDGSTLSDVVAELGLKADRIAVECNGEIAGRGGWGSLELKSGDRLEIVHFVGGGSAAGSFPSVLKPEFYLLRRYHLQYGTQTRLAEQYLADALIPALKRLQFGPIGAFRLTIGPETPNYYLLIPGESAEELVKIDQALAADPEFLRTGEAFWAAPATAPAYQRVHSSLLRAFPGWPKLTPQSRTSRILQLRFYEAPSDRDHVLKVGMFGDGEIEIFLKVGFHPVFFADQLIGEKMPRLVYMLRFADMAELEGKWQAFLSDPAWTKLKSSSKYGFEELVTSIGNLILEPLPMSEI